MHERRDLPVGQLGHGLAHGPGQRDREVEVDQAAVDRADQGRDRCDVGLGEGLGAAGLGEAQRAPEAAGLVEGQTGLGRHLGGVVERLLAEDRTPELGVRLRLLHRRAACGSWTSLTRLWISSLVFSTRGHVVQLARHRWSTRR